MAAGAGQSRSAGDLPAADGVDVQSLRKTATATLMERGVSLRVIQEVLGDAKLETTASNLGVGRRALDEAMAALDA